MWGKAHGTFAVTADASDSLGPADLLAPPQRRQWQLTAAK